MKFTVVITKDRNPRSYRWTIRSGVNQPNALPLSRSERDPSHARRAAERVLGSLNWQSADEAGAVYDYIVQVADVEIAPGPQWVRADNYIAQAENARIDTPETVAAKAALARVLFNRLVVDK